MAKTLASILTLLLLLSACSIMDISSQDTAVPLAPKKVEVGLYEGLGIELASIAGIENDSGWDEPIGWIVTGAKFGISLSPKVDLVGRAYNSGASWGGKLGIKVLARQQGNNYIALVPSLTAVLNDVAAENGEGDQVVAKALGGEMKALSSWVLSKHFTATLGARANYSSLQSSVWENNIERIEYRDVFHGGVSGNVRINTGAFWIAPELGLEVVPQARGDRIIYPTGSLGLGLQF